MAFLTSLCANEAVETMVTAAKDTATERGPSLHRPHRRECSQICSALESLPELKSVEQSMRSILGHFSLEGKDTLAHINDLLCYLLYLLLTDIRLLRNNALLRIGFAFYLLLLHLWVLLILVVQTHSLEDLSSSSDPKDRLFPS